MDVNKPTLASREGAVAAREQTATVREGAASAREGAANQRDNTAALRDDAAGARDEAAGLREGTSTLREEAVRAREAAAEARAELEQLMVQMREANERLIVGTLRAQTMTEVAEEANHLKDEFLATVSHELRTPLNAIVGWARILGTKPSSPELATQGIAAIERNAWALAHIIDDLLDMSRIAAGTLQMLAQPVDLAAVARAALETVEPAAVAKHVQLSFTADPAAVETISGDASRLEQVIWNLLANAIKFTPAGGRVDVFLERSGDFMQIRVVDTGQGISADFLPHMFGRFRQGEGVTTGRHSGLGLGLSIVRQLIELHRGTVQADSNGPGCGATFTIRLPISAADPITSLRDRRAGTADLLPTPRLSRLDTSHILVVDASAEGRTLTALMLTQAGAAVTTAATVQETLQIFGADRFDALVSEVNMQGEDGYELIRRIRQHEADHGGFLPAVALTGYTRAEDRNRVLAAGFQAHIPKPVASGDLANIIATLIRDARGRPA